MPRGALAAVAEVIVRATHTVTVGEIDSVTDWKAKEIRDNSCSEAFEGKGRESEARALFLPIVRRVMPIGPLHRATSVRVANYKDT